MEDVIKVPVNERAAHSRLKRKLGKSGISLKSCSPRSQLRKDIGELFTVGRDNEIIETHLKLSDLIVREKILKDFEEMIPKNPLKL